MFRKMLLAVVVLLSVLIGLGFWSYNGAVASVDTREKVVALTYDDGPNPPYTEQMLAVLKEHDVVATFFPKGSNVAAFPDEARAIVAAGHEVANHSYDHFPMGSLSKDAMIAEVERAQAVLQLVMGVDPEMFRPPFGTQFIGLKRALDELGLTSVLASSHGSDWEETDANTVAQSVLQDVEPGGIVLLHDGHGDVADPHAQESRAHSVAATEIIIKSLKKQGYRFVTVSELLAMRP